MSDFENKRPDEDFVEYDSPKESADERAYRVVEDLSRPKTVAYSVASLVLGILSVICCCFSFVSLVCGVLAIVFAVVSRKHLGYFDGMSIAGLVCGIFGTVLGVASIIASLTFDYAAFWEEFYNSFPQESIPPSDL